MKKNEFPGFDACLAMMRKPDGDTSERGFGLLQSRAAQFLPELMTEFEKETNSGLQFWFLELIVDARSDAAFDFLAEQLQNENEAFRNLAADALRSLNTKKVRTLLFEHGFSAPSQKLA